MLHIAVESGQIDIVQMLIDIFKVDVDPRDGDRMTPLMYAAINGYSDIVNFLIEKVCFVVVLCLILSYREPISMLNVGLVRMRSNWLSNN